MKTTPPTLTQGGGSRGPKDGRNRGRSHSEDIQMNSSQFRNQLKQIQIKLDDIGQEIRIVELELGRSLGNQEQEEIEYWMEVMKDKAIVQAKLLVNKMNLKAEMRSGEKEEETVVDLTEMDDRTTSITDLTYDSPVSDHEVVFVSVNVVRDEKIDDEWNKESVLSCLDEESEAAGIGAKKRMNSNVMSESGVIIDKKVKTDSLCCVGRHDLKDATILSALKAPDDEHQSYCLDLMEAKKMYTASTV